MIHIMHTYVQVAYTYILAYLQTYFLTNMCTQIRTCIGQCPRVNLSWCFVYTRVCIGALEVGKIISESFGSLSRWSGCQRGISGTLQSRQMVADTFQPSSGAAAALFLLSDGWTMAAAPHSKTSTDGDKERDERGDSGWDKYTDSE